MLERAFRAGLAGCDARTRTAEALRSEASSRIVALAAGKAAPAMLAGLFDACGERIHEALLVVPEDLELPALDARVRIRVATHPLPSDRSVLAAEDALALRPNLVLLSGGASALLCAPCAGVTLAQKIALTDALLKSGADVREINTVRRHLSRIKGGGLAKDVRRTILVSDVLFGKPEDVGSGPSVPDPTTVADARRILAKYGMAGEFPFVETAKPDELMPAPVDVVLEPAHLAQALADVLAVEGYAARVLPPSTAPVAELADAYAAIARSLRPGEAVIRVAEPALKVEVQGEGGRCSHLAAMLAGRLPPGVTFLAAASDGVDGKSGTGGAIVDGPLDGADDALARFDTGPLHRRHGTALPEHPTGMNLADVHAMARATISPAPR